MSFLRRLSNIGTSTLIPRPTYIGFSQWTMNVNTKSTAAIAIELDRTLTVEMQVTASKFVAKMMVAVSRSRWCCTGDEIRDFARRNNQLRTPGDVFGRS